MTEEEKRALNELMGRISKGDEAARETLADKYYRAVFCFIFKLIGSKEDAKDLTQETFLKLCRNGISDKTWTNGYSYLFRTAKNLCIDRFRKRKKDENTFLWEVEKAKTYIWDGPEDLDTIFSCLTESEEKLVLLRYKSGYSVREIARKTGIPARTLDRRFTDIKNKIREATEYGNKK